METPIDMTVDSTSSAAPSEPLARWRGLKKRVLSALFMLTVVLFCEMAGGVWFMGLVILVALLMLREWDTLTAGWGVGWQVGGLAYIGLPCMALLWLRSIMLPDMADAGMRLVLYVIFVVMACDVGAYFAGKQIGGPALAPSISPKKTWAGLGGGVVAAAIVGGICASFTPYPFTLMGCIFGGAALAVIGQIGDLFESWVKRRAGVKDSGGLIPGHGGLLDRVDGIIAAVPVFALAVAFSGIVV